MFTKSLGIEDILPFKSHYATVSGHQMHYLDEGSGPVVILLHGNPTWCFYFRTLIGRLKTNYRVIAPDYLGCGLSDRPPAETYYRATDRIQQVEDLIAHLKLDKYSLIMHDWGGPIGTGVAIRNTAALEKIVYLNTTLTETEALPGIIRMAAKPVIGKYLTKTSRRFLKLTTGLGAAKKLPKRVKEGYFFPYKTSADRAAIWGFVADIPFDSNHPSYAEMMNIAENLPLLRDIPVRIIWGLKDPCFHREMLSKVARHFPQAKVHEIPEASHLVLEDAPDEVGESIEQFLLEEKPTVKTPEEDRQDETSIRPGNGTNPLYASFKRYAEANSQQDAIIVPGFLGETVRYTHMNFNDLRGLINKYQRGLQDLGLTRGDRVLMLVSPGIDFLALSYAVMGRGAIPVFLDPGMGKDNLFQSIADCNPNVFIGSPKAHLLKILKKNLFSKLKFSIIARDWFFTRGYNLSNLKKFASTELPDVQSTGTVLIAFTSGGTGVPKGVVFTDEMVKGQLNLFSNDFGLKAGGKDMPLLPIFSLFNLANGVCSVFPPLDPGKPLALKPSRIIKIVNDLGIKYSFGSPTLWNKIGEYCLRTRTTLDSVESIFMAGAPVSKKTLTLVKGIIPKGEAYTPYGATEALPVTLISSEEVMATAETPAISGEQGTLVGKPVNGVQLKVVRVMNGAVQTISDVEEVSEGEIGEIIVSGQTVSPAYLNRIEATKLAKIRDGSHFWHRMGDMGYLDEEGRVYFCGRVAHTVEVPGKVYYSIPTERILNQHAKVRRSALVKLEKKESAAIVIEPLPQYWPESAEEKSRFINELKELATTDTLTSSIEDFFFHRSFPVDGRHNAKIFRDKLGVWANQEVSSIKEKS